MQKLLGPKRQLAEMLNLSERRITALVTAGVLTARGPRGFDLTASVRGYIRFLKSKSRTLTDERARLVKCQADAAELNFRERTGELILRSAVADIQFKVGRRVRDGILNVPSRISGSCAAETDQHKIHALLTRELTQALEGLASACVARSETRIFGVK